MNETRGILSWEIRVINYFISIGGLWLLWKFNLVQLPEEATLAQLLLIGAAYLSLMEFVGDTLAYISLAKIKGGCLLLIVIYFYQGKWAFDVLEFQNLITHDLNWFWVIALGLLLAKFKIPIVMVSLK